MTHSGFNDSVKSLSLGLVLHVPVMMEALRDLYVCDLIYRTWLTSAMYVLEKSPFLCGA